MALKNLTDDQLRILDYILNYTPEERIQAAFDEDAIEDLDQFVEKSTSTDDYSNRFNVFSISEEHKEEIREAIDEQFEDLYVSSIEEELEQLFDEQPQNAFRFYNEVQRERVETGDSNYVQPHDRNHSDLPGFLDRLQEIGIGFRRIYQTTTDNFYEQFEFRSFPFDGLERFIEIAEEILRGSLQDFSPAEMWAAYINAYLSQNYHINNLGGYSRNQIDSALENPRIQAKENITFLNEDIKSHLHWKLQEAIERDTFYLSVIEFIKTASTESTSGDESNFSFPIDILEELPHGERENIEPYIEQLHHYGLLLKRDGEYLLTEEAKEVLDEVEQRSKIESYPIDTFREAQNTLYQIFATADEEIKIIDRYFTREALRIVDSNSPNDVRKRILYSDKVDDEDVEQLQDELNDSTIDDSNYEFKEMQEIENAGIPHDRFIIVDNRKVWQVGHSFNGLGNDFSTIFSHSEEESPRYVQLFDNLWQQGETLSW